MVNKHVIILVDDDFDNGIIQWIESGIKSVSGIKCIVYKTHEIDDVSIIQGYDTYIFGCPSYSGRISAKFTGFIEFIEGSSILRNKRAAGFIWVQKISDATDAPLHSLAMFAAQQGMLWIPQGQIEKYEAINAMNKQNINRFNSQLGNISQNTTEIDFETAYFFGKRVGELSK